LAFDAISTGQNDISLVTAVMAATEARIIANLCRGA
jgi:hypothetical protein